MPHFSSVAPPLTLMARIFAFEPFFQLANFGCDRANFDGDFDWDDACSCSLVPRLPYSSGHQDEELVLPHQPAIPSKVVSTKWDVADNIGNQTDHRQPSSPIKGACYDYLGSCWSA